MLTGKTGLVFENETNTVADPGGGESRSILTSEYIEIFKIPRDFSENLVPLLQKSAPPPLAERTKRWKAKNKYSMSTRIEKVLSNDQHR